MEPEQRVFDRRPRWDVRNDFFRAAAAPETVGQELRSFTWKPGETLDQGNEGACVGFGFEGELLARPLIVRPADPEGDARSIYHDARLVDEWVGEDYEGTSVLAGAKVLVSRGHITGYRWAKTVSELALAVGYLGPAVIGVDWHTGMDQADSAGFIHVDGPVRGGHCLLVYSVAIVTRKRVVPYFGLRNSWGDPAMLKVSFDDMAKLLAEFGEACIPTGRRRV